MAVPLGKHITGRAVEQETSAWPPEHFASMCDALSWAVSGRVCPSLPRFTTQVNAPDGGVDAEWAVEVKDGSVAVPTPIVGPGWNVFQYKKRDLLAQDKRRIVSGLKSSLKGAIKEVATRRGRHPDRYILFVNVGLSVSDLKALRESLLEEYSQEPQPLIEVVDAGQLAAFLNDHPHIRAAFFAPLSFKIWRAAYEAHRAQKLFAADVELIGRETAFKQLKSLVDDPRVRVIIVSGLHGMGKSRLALEATRHRPYDVVVALDPRSMSLRDYRNLCSDHGEVLCIVEDPEPGDLSRLINEALTLSTLKLLVTLPTAAKVPIPMYGFDNRVQSLYLEPLSYEDARKLLKATGKTFEFGIEAWIIRHAGGNPGVLLAAAAVGSELRRGVASFTQSVGEEFARRVERELGDDALRCARLLSILEHVGISGTFAGELALICELFGEGWTTHNVLGWLDEIERAGLARRGGSFAHITVPLFANYLAAKLLRGRLGAVLALFARLSDQGRTRLIGRLSQITGEEATQFWDAVFAPDGLLGKRDALEGNAHVLANLAAAKPERLLQKLKAVLGDLSFSERRAIADDLRRDLMEALEQLLFRSKTSEKALQLIGLLAEAENEAFANNATGVFKECFHPLHPQMPLPLSTRSRLLQDFISGNASKERKVLAVQAIEEAFRRVPPVFWLRHGFGSEPLDQMAGYTADELVGYYRRLMDILFDLAREEGEVSAVALGVLPNVTAEFGIQASPREAVERFGTLTDWARSNHPNLDVASLLAALRDLRDHLADQLGKDNFPEDRRAEVERHVARLNQMKSDLEEASFSIKLKRWAGQWTNDPEADETQSDGRLKFEVELEKLAQNVVKNPGLLTSDLMTWLVSPSGQKAHVFFYHLGAIDTGGIFRQQIEQLGQCSEGTSAFSAYCGGWAQRDRPAAEAWLDQLARTNAVAGEAIVSATRQIGPSQAAVDRVVGQLKLKRVAPQYVASELWFRRWLEGLSEAQFARLLTAIAGDEFEQGTATLRMLGMWRHLGRPVQGDLAELAWQCLEHHPVVTSSTDAWNIDRLAARLAKDNPERGFKLLERTCANNQDERNRWNPLEGARTSELWKVLHAEDRRRLISVLLRAAQKNPIMEMRISWKVPELIDQDSDKDVLITLAKKDIECARMIAGWMTSARPGFWPLCFALHELYPQDERLHVNLAAAIQQMGSVITGPMSRFYEDRRKEVEEKLNDPSVPSDVKRWLREVAERLGEGIGRGIIWEYDLDVNDLRSSIRSRDSGQRLWAIGRILKYADWKDIRHLLTVEDIEEALPHVDLPEKRRKMLEQAIPVWRYGA